MTIKVQYKQEKTDDGDDDDGDAAEVYLWQNTRTNKNRLIVIIV